MYDDGRRNADDVLMGKRSARDFDPGSRAPKTRVLDPGCRRRAPVTRNRFAGRCAGCRTYLDPLSLFFIPEQEEPV
jgi:hypothetical protein